MLDFQTFLEQLRKLPKIVQLVAIEKYRIEQFDLENVLMTQITSFDHDVEGVEEINFIGREVALRIPADQLSLETLLKAQESMHIEVQTLAAELIMKHFPEYLTFEMLLVIQRCVDASVRSQAMELMLMLPKEKISLEKLLEDLNDWDEAVINTAFTLILKHFPEHVTLKMLLDIHDSYDESIHVRAKEFAIKMQKEQVSLDTLIQSLEKDYYDLVILVGELTQKHFSNELEEMFKTELQDLGLV